MNHHVLLTFGDLTWLPWLNPWQVLESEQLPGELYQEELVFFLPCWAGWVFGLSFFWCLKNEKIRSELRVKWATLCFFSKRSCIHLIRPDPYFTINGKEHTTSDRTRQQFEAGVFLFKCLAKSLNSWIGAFIIPGWSNIYVPRTQMTLVLIGRGLVLEGWPSKIEVSWVLGIYNLLFMRNQEKPIRCTCACMGMSTLRSILARKLTLIHTHTQGSWYSCWYIPRTSTNDANSKKW